jgi:hypothetical protein
LDGPSSRIELQLGINHLSSAMSSWKSALDMCFELPESSDVQRVVATLKLEAAIRSPASKHGQPTSTQAAGWI